MTEGPVFNKVMTREMIYHLTGDNWNLYTVSELTKQIASDGFGPEAEIQFDMKNGAAKVTQANSY